MVYLRELLAPLGRSERRHWGEVYVRGLLLDGERKSIEPLAGRLLDGNVQALQQFIGQSPWQHNPVRRLLAEKMAKALLPVCVWIIDDTGFPKKGKYSVGVSNQYSGSLGKVGNCQVAVSLHMGTEDACVPVNYALYLPKEWTGDPKRLERAGVPAQAREFKSKFDLALGLIDEAMGWSVPRGVMLADAFYGKASVFRQGLLDRGLDYVVEVTGKLAVYGDETGKVAELSQAPSRRGMANLLLGDLARQWPEEGWTAIKWREGTKKGLASRFACLRVMPIKNKGKDAVQPPVQWLLMEQASDREPSYKFWFSNLPPETKLEMLVRLAKARWMIEQNYQQQKEELGLDHYEGRGYLGWHHHVTMNMIAFGFLLLETLRVKKNFWVEPAQGTQDSADHAGDLDRGLPDMR